jgi:hypothetical protein
VAGGVGGAGGGGESDGISDAGAHLGGLGGCGMGCEASGAPEMLGVQMNSELEDRVSTLHWDIP